MTKTFILSDPHFGHNGIITFKDDKGKPLRDFPTIQDHDDYIVDKCNSVVSPKDRLYVLGDVSMNRRHISQVARLNGRKVLIKGNHDIFKLNDYAPYFDDVRAYKIFPSDGIIMSHIPVHPVSLGRRFKLNVHGHTHSNNVPSCFFGEDPRYLSVCLEKLKHYTPIDFNEVLWYIESVLLTSPQ